uniref:Uncharacterized protein n=1 Tax=Anguilla anguilla TaxID=7936 RepID=A0A0E9U9D2_ANGAN
MTESLLMGSFCRMLVLQSKLFSGPEVLACVVISELNHKRE